MPSPAAVVRFNRLATGEGNLKRRRTDLQCLTNRLKKIKFRLNARLTGLKSRQFSYVALNASIKGFTSCG